MMPASPLAETVRRFGDAGGHRDEGLRAAALGLLQASGYSALRGLRCEVTEAVAVVHGVLPSYHLKQMAQAAVPLPNLDQVPHAPEAVVPLDRSLGPLLEVVGR
jgi:hypothetical protein